MPFLNGTDNTIFCVLGEGDVLMSPGRVDGGPHPQALCLEQIEGGRRPPEGEPDADGFYEPAEDGRPKLVIVCPTPRSIDALLASLRNLRQSPFYAGPAE